MTSGGMTGVTVKDGKHLQVTNGSVSARIAVDGQEVEEDKACYLSALAAEVGRIVEYEVEVDVLCFSDMWGYKYQQMMDSILESIPGSYPECYRKDGLGSNDICSSPDRFDNSWHDRWRVRATYC
ncbi:hypothetical protein RhiJN_20634 [Ceratobasidium sp. AG-Ba]|nr:hypothetical protein RhiJN_20634 [Ceratobasidium sp. AG-Ba]